MTQEEFIEILEDLNGDAYVLQPKEPMTGAQAAAIKNAWKNMNDVLGTHKPLLLIPHTMQLRSISKGTFNFSIALMLLDLGYCIAREKWTEGYIFKEGGIIKQSHSSKEWIPTQGALRAVDWKITKGVVL